MKQLLKEPKEEEEVVDNNNSNNLQKKKKSKSRPFPNKWKKLIFYLNHITFIGARLISSAT